jgi:secreted trypsin-like serine protease
VTRRAWPAAAALLASCGLAGAPAPAPAAAPGAGDRAPRIVGGGPVAIEDAPFQVGLVVAHGRGASTRCGGAILSPTRVATAAHCLERPDTGTPVAPAAVEVRAAAARIDGSPPGQQRSTAASLAIHPGYDGTYADAAVITLATQLDLSGPRARAIALTDEGDGAVSEPGDLATVTGWGRVAQDGPASAVLRGVEVPLVSDAACAVAYGAFRAAALLCAGDLAAGGRDSCQGDSGGPLVVRNGAAPKLVGLVSSGAGCANARCPGVYTEVLDPPVRSFLAGEPVLPGRPDLIGTGVRPACAPMRDAPAAPPAPAPVPGGAPAPVPGGAPAPVPGGAPAPVAAPAPPAPAPAPPAPEPAGP